MIIEIIHFIQSITQTGIYLISSNLLYPVIIILMGLIFWSLIEFGCFLFEWHTRKRDLDTIEKGVNESKALLEKSNYIEAAGKLNKLSSNEFVYDFTTSLSKYHKEFHDRRIMQLRVEKLLQDCETNITKKLERSRFIAKAAPMFGLMGTLIPMGPALMALSEGDTQALADNLIIAFGTTVIGLVGGVTEYFISMVRSRWYAQDISDIEFISELLFGGSSEATPMINMAKITKTDTQNNLDVTESIPEPEIEKHIKNVPKKDNIIVVKVISDFVYFDLFFTPTSLIIAKTAGHVLNRPAIFAVLSIFLNVVIILASIKGYTVLPLPMYLLFMNILMIMIFIMLKRATKQCATRKSNELTGLPQNVILLDNPCNLEVNYSDIKELNVSESQIKILTTDKWEKIGHMTSPEYLDILSVLPLSVTIGEKT